MAHAKNFNTENILEEISNTTSLDLLSILNCEENQEPSKSSNRMQKTKNLGRLQSKYYRRISKLKKLGLIEVKNSELTLSSLGIIVVRSIETISKAIDIYAKLRAVDIVSMSNIATDEEIHKLIDSLITDEKIRNVLKRFPTALSNSR
ncbi:MAG TPA: hypothetical protein VF884_06605 [Nitrososphaeraceae archaeon]